jgi:hypothetical protein
VNEAVLAGKKIGIVVENKFIPDEIAAYQSGFAILGTEFRLKVMPRSVIIWTRSREL